MRARSLPDPAQGPGRVHGTDRLPARARTRRRQRSPRNMADAHGALDAERSPSHTERMADESSVDASVAVPSFFCDAMLGGLARWLRAVGYEAAFEHGIDDGDLVSRALATGAVLLSSDRPLFNRRPMR